MKVIVVIDVNDDVPGYRLADVVDWIKQDLADWQVVDIQPEQGETDG